MFSHLFDPSVWSIVLLSLQVSFVAMLVSLPLAIIIGKILAGPGFIGRAF